MTWTQVYDPLGHWWLSTLVAALPIVVLLGLLAGLKVRPHWCAIAGATTAVLCAIFVFGMPTKLALASFLYGGAFGLTGCFGLVPIAMTTASFYTASATGKYPVDHLVSMATGEDCAAVHVEARQSYCLDKKGEVIGLAAEKQCFRTLGQVQCYIGPDPYGTRPNQIQDPPQAALQ